MMSRLKAYKRWWVYQRQGKRWPEEACRKEVAWRQQFTKGQRRRRDIQDICRAATAAMIADLGNS